MTMNKLFVDDGGTWKVTTYHGTYYIIDLDKMRGMRVPGEGRNAMRADSDWFNINSIICQVGESMHFLCTGIAEDDWYTWRMSTEVVSIEPA
jgi:hypothetical protein